MRSELLAFYSEPISKRLDIIKEVLLSFPKHVKVFIQTIEKDSTVKQLKYFKGILVPMYAKHMGIPNSEASEELLNEFNLQYGLDDWGKPSLLVRKINEDDRHTVADVIERLQAWLLLEHGLNVPRSHELIK